MMKVADLSNKLFEEAPSKSTFYPVDRAYLNTQLKNVQSVDGQEFVIYNLEIFPQTYTNQLLLCLPEVWKNFDYDDWLSITNSLKSEIAQISEITFLYKYLRINAFDILLKSDSALNIKKLSKYFLNVLGSLDFDEDVLFDLEQLGVPFEDILDAQEHLMEDNRILKAFDNVISTKGYLLQLMKTATN